MRHFPISLQKSGLAVAADPVAAPSSKFLGPVGWWLLWPEQIWKNGKVWLFMVIYDMKQIEFGCGYDNFM